MLFPMNQSARTLSLITFAGLLCFAGTALGAEVAAAEPVATSTAPFGLKLIMRWVHIVAAVVLVGGTFFQWYALLPAAATLEDDARQKFRAALLAKWKIIVPIGILMFLASGFYNYLAVTRFAHQGDKLYNMLFGIKFLLAMGVFALASIMTGRSKLAQKMQANPGKGLGILLTLSLAVVLIGGFMKVM